MMFWEEDQEKDCEVCKQNHIEELKQQMCNYEYEIALQNQIDAIRKIFVRDKNMSIIGRTTGWPK